LAVGSGKFISEGEMKQSAKTHYSARNEVNRMSNIMIDASELKDEGKQVVQAFADFVKEKTGAEVTNESNKVTVKGEGKTVSKKYLRVLVKKFLHKQELKEYYRVISGDEGILKVKERKLYEED
jgi:hypothetical protein